MTEFYKLDAYFLVGRALLKGLSELNDGEDQNGPKPWEPVLKAILTEPEHHKRVELVRATANLLNTNLKPGNAPAP